jgi:phosphoenolpyruvate-protein phosphotransferase (PTS system enzyme I)
MSNPPKFPDQSSPAERSGSRMNTLLKGIAVSSGVAIGQAVILDRRATELYPQRIISPDEIPFETARFEEAVEEAGAELTRIRDAIHEGHPLEDHAYIFDTHLLLLSDRMFFGGTKTAIAAERQNAEWAVAGSIKKIESAFATIDDEYLRERARDVHFVGERVLRLLMGRSDERGMSQLPPNTVIVAHDISPADTVQFERSNVIAFATDMGGRTSHAAIMARSLKIPAVTGLEHLARHIQTGDTVIVDGGMGVVILNPDPDTLFRYRRRREIHRNYHKALMTYGRLPAVTNEGACSVRILANVELLDELELAKDHGAEGIGLFRTEYLFLGRKDLPSEEEQYEVYRRVLTSAAPLHATIRTLDAGADKIAASLNLPIETNPAMGLRAIRLCLEKRDIFKTQLRAVLRAAVHGRCRLLIPMISCLTELLAVKEIIAEVKTDLARAGKVFDPQLELGVLVEVPSAVVIADLLAKEADFFSIGTNDLIQYALAIDRVNEHVNYLYETLHPAVLRLIRQIAVTGQAWGIPVGMCGEMAGDPVNIPILLGIGMDELSMNAFAIPMVKKFIRAVSIDECRDLTAQAFEMPEAQEIRNLLEGWIRERFPNDYFIDQ